MAKDYEIYPEPGESFAIAGEVEIKIKGFGHAIRKGNLVITDRRIAFKGKLAVRSLGSAIRRVAGSGGMDISIPYWNVREVRDKGYLSGFHIEIFFFDEESGKVKRLRVRIKKWSVASKAIHGANFAVEAAHAGEIIAREVDFLPIVGDFFKLGADFAEYRAGSKAAKVWIDTVQRIMNDEGLSFQPVSESELDDEEKEEELTCNNCGAQIESTWKACPECGSDLPRICQNCGSVLEEDWAICPFCDSDSVEQ